MTEETGNSGEEAATASAVPVAEAVVSRMSVSGFRCLTDLTIDFERDVTYLVGQNNAGKTSIMMALASAFGARRPNTDDLRIGKDGSRVPKAVIDVYLSPAVGDSFGAVTGQRLANVQRRPGTTEEVVGFRTTLKPSLEGAWLSDTRQFLQPDAAGVWDAVEAPPLTRRVLELVEVQQVDASRDLLEDLGRRSSGWGRVLANLGIPDHDDLEDGSPHPYGRRGLEQTLGEVAARLRSASPVLSVSSLRRATSRRDLLLLSRCLWGWSDRAVCASRARRTRDRC